MKLRLAILSAVFLVVTAISVHDMRATAQERVPSACVVTVPSNWGAFKGISTSGVAFEDESGTIRILDQMPCGMDRGVVGQPNVLVEIRRK